MKFSIDITEKEICYSKDLPLGHRKALEKIYLSQGYKFREVINIFAIGEEDIHTDMAESHMVKGHSRPVVYTGTHGAQAFDNALKNSMHHELQEWMNTTRSGAPELTAEDIEKILNELSNGGGSVQAEPYGNMDTQEWMRYVKQHGIHFTNPKKGDVRGHGGFSGLANQVTEPQRYNAGQRNNNN